MKPTKQSRVRSTAVLASVALVSLSACTSPSAPAAGSDAAGDLVVLISESTAYVPCLEEYAKKFAAEPDGVGVQIQTEPFATLRDKTLTAFASGSAPWDLVGLPYQYVRGYKTFLQPLGDKVNAEFMNGINETATNLYTLEDELYAVPFAAQAESLFYRTDLFEKAGLKPPATWEEFNKTADFFTDNPEFPGITGTTLKGGLPWNGTEFNDRYLGLGGETLSGRPGTKIDTGLAVKALKNLKETADNYAQSGALATTQPEAAALFASGASAMSVLMPSTVTATITAPGEANKVLGKVGIASMPGGVGESGGFGLTIPVSSKRADAAMRFTEFVKSQEADIKCMVSYGNGAVRDASYDDTKVKDLWYSQGFFKTLDAAEYLIGAQSPEAGKIGTSMNTIVSQYLAGQIATPEEAAQKLAASYTSLVG